MMPRRVFLAGGAAYLLPGCATLVSTAPSDAGGAEPRERWERVLAGFVDAQGRVDFERLATQRGDLDAYVAWVNHIGPENQPALFATPAQVLAYHLNAYNALAMHAVLAAGIPATLAGLRKISFFYFQKVQVAGRALSLYAYENEVIRALKEPRVHFALNCMSVSCPRLPREPFDAPRLEAQLERESRLFFSEPRNLRVNDATRTVALSEILSFYKADFLVAAPTLPAYASRYRETSVPDDYAVVFIPYDWTVNSQSRAPG